MKKFLLVLAALLVPTLASAEQVFFATDKSDISFIEKEKLITLAEKVKSDGSKVVIIGNADKRGSRLYNLDLGMRRATSVAKELMELGVPADQLSISLSYGEEKPLAPADNLKEHLAKNRRVDLVLVEAKTTETVVTLPVEVVKEIPAYRKNRISLLGGAGPSGLGQETLGPNHYKVDQNYKPVFGLSYTRSLTDRWNIGLTGLSNNSYFVNFGFDF